MNQFGAMEVEEAVAQFRAWFAAAPLATYEYQTLPVKEIRSVLTRTFRESPYDGATEIIAEWSLRPSDAKAHCGSYLRVGMAKEREASRPSDVQLRNSDGTRTEKGRRRATLDYNSLPRTPPQVAKKSAAGCGRGAVGITHDAEVRGQGKRGSGALRDEWARQESAVRVQGNPSATPLAVETSPCGSQSVAVRSLAGFG